MEKLILWLENAAMAVGALCAFSIMLALSYDALSRYLLHAPQPWAFDLISNYLLIGATYLVLSSTFRHRDHMNIDIIHMMLPKRARTAANIGSGVIAAIAFALIAYGNWNHVADAYERGAYFPGIILWPVWLSYLPIAIGTSLLVLRLVHHSYMIARFGDDRNIEKISEIQE
jgi:TRAP-type C4-dicarboxylate transport system permease small subunit